MDLTDLFSPFLEKFQILMAAGDTFRAAARDQLEVWAERTESDIVVAPDEKTKAQSGMCQVNLLTLPSGFESSHHDLMRW